jgi:hypothetical protein
MNQWMCKYCDTTSVMLFGGTMKIGQEGGVVQANKDLQAQEEGAAAAAEAYCLPLTSSLPGAFKAEYNVYTIN